MFSVEGVSIGFPGRPLAVRNATLHVDDGEFVALLGTNGSGKSELIQGISGLIPVQRGSVTLDGRNFRKMAAHRIVTSGIALVPEGRHVFTAMTVRDNLEVTVHRRDRAMIDGVLEQFPILEERSDQLASALSGGEQQQLAIARALLMRPKLLLLDEPSAGLSPVMVKSVYERLETLRNEMAILVVEQVASLVLNRVDRVYVMRAGEIVKEARPQELADPAALPSLYFGEARKTGVSGSQAVPPR